MFCLVQITEHVEASYFICSMHLYCDLKCPLWILTENCYLSASKEVPTAIP